MTNERAFTAESSNLHFSIHLPENRESIDISSDYEESSPIPAGKKKYLLYHDNKRGLLLFYLLIPKIRKSIGRHEKAYVDRILQLAYVLSNDRREYWKVDYHIDLKQHQHTPLLPAQAKPIQSLITNINEDLQALNAFLFKRITQLTISRNHLKTFSIVSSVGLLIVGVGIGGGIPNSDIYIATGLFLCLFLSIVVPIMVRGRLKRKLTLNEYLKESLFNSPTWDVSQDAKSLLMNKDYA